MHAKTKLCIVVSSGGHLVKTYFLKDWWRKHQRVWVTRQDQLSVDLLQNETVVHGFFPEQRHFPNLVRNFLLAMYVYLIYRPTHVFSTGAGIAIPFFLVAKVCGIKTIFLETFITINHPTLTGKVLYHLSDTFIVQQRELCKTYPKAKYWGGLWV